MFLANEASGWTTDVIGEQNPLALDLINFFEVAAPPMIR
jgi:hypothetical protein